MSQNDMLCVTKKEPMISEAVYLAFLPICGYVMSFLYEYSYSIHFRIPIELLEVSVMSSLMMSIALLIATIVFLVILGKLLSWWNKRSDSFKAIMDSPALDFLLFVYLAILCYRSVIGFITVVAVFILRMLYFFIRPAFPYRSIKKYKDRLLALQVKVSPSEALFNVLKNTIGRKNIKLGLIALFVMIICFHVGINEATSKSSFLVTDDNQVVLRRYNDVFVCAPYDPLTYSVSTSFTIIPVDDIDIPLHLKQIGPLSVTTH